ncbi:MAG: hypothetical protein KDD67_10310 [Ignavibacteriae bacterium]|nr:hypothetical protein [Ignavibacteriota bacterium]MCB9214821.1 hypothetical protein [Ignavibacteria bacterium]
MHYRTFYLYLSIVLLAGCSSATDGNVDRGSDPQPRGERVLAVDVNEAEGESYDAVVNRANSVGANTFSLSIGWDDIETAPGIYNPAVDLLAIANSYYPTRNASVALMVGPVDTNNDRLPSDLKGKAFDDSVVVNRYKRLLDYLFSKIPDLDLAVLAIGNEVDFFLANDLEAWAAYKRFFDETSSYARQLRPGLNVGVKVTLAGLRGVRKEEARVLNEKSDAILTTHYPLNADFTVQDPSVVDADFDQVVELYPNRSIWFMELGYPSSPVCNSSEEKQGEFIREVFSAWDKHRGKIDYISFGIMSDRSQGAIDELSRYYGLNDQIFLEYLRTLGLRTYPNGGEDKVSWAVLKEEAVKRGW